MLTGLGDREVDVEAAEAGAADYLVKGDVTPALLERTIRYAMRHHADMRALRASEEGLRQGQRMEAVGRFAGGVAHDFNNMMSAVVGFSALVLDALPEDDPLRRYVSEIQHAGERASGMTKQLLAFTRKQVLSPQVLDLNRVVGDVHQLLARLVGEDVEIETDLAPSLCPIEADAGQLEQVIVNLAVNARDAMPHGGRLTIATKTAEIVESDGSELEAGTYAALSVTDTGEGMSPETLRQIFEPFFTTKEEGKGTGLGLATVFGIVKQSGGEIQVDSTLGTRHALHDPAAARARDGRRAARAGTRGARPARHGDDPAGRGRGARAQPRARGARGARLHGARGARPRAMRSSSHAATPARSTCCSPTS